MDDFIENTGIFSDIVEAYIPESFKVPLMDIRKRMEMDILIIPRSA